MGLEIAKDKPLGTTFKTSELTNNSELMNEVMGENCKLVKITYSFVGDTEVLFSLGLSAKDFNEEDYEDREEDDDLDFDGICDIEYNDP